MRRIFLVTTLLITAFPPPAPAQSVGGHAMQYQEARASWEAGRSSDGRYLFGFFVVWRYTNSTGATSTLAQHGIVRCRLRGKRAFVYSCKEGGRIFSIRRRAFDMDPTLRSATVSFVHQGRKSNLIWTARNERLEPQWSVAGGKRSVGLSMGLSARADARGRVFGKRLTKGQAGAQATLGRGLLAGVLYEAGARTFTVRATTRDAARDAVLRRIIR